jgi:hypothetical protein
MGAGIIATPILISPPDGVKGAGERIKDEGSRIKQAGRPSDHPASSFILYPYF